MDGVEKNWTINQRGTDVADASNIRSKTTPGMALAMAACAIDRFLCYMKMRGRGGYATIEYDPSKLVKTYKKHEMCNHKLSNGSLCNLRNGHHTSADNHKRGLGNEHGIFCYDTNKYLYIEPPYKNAKRSRSNSDPMFDLLPFEASTVKKIVFTNVSAALVEKVTKKDPLKIIVEKCGNILSLYKYYKIYTCYETTDKIIWRKLM